MINPFFKNTGPHSINFLLKHINLNNDNLPDDKITDIKDLNSSEKSEITFLHSLRKQVYYHILFYLCHEL